MNKQNLMDRILSVKPNILILGGFVLIIAFGVLGEYFS
jgi:hypothetical protein